MIPDRARRLRTYNNIARGFDARASVRFVESIPRGVAPDGRLSAPPTGQLRLWRRVRDEEVVEFLIELVPIGGEGELEAFCHELAHLMRRHDLDEGLMRRFGTWAAGIFFANEREAWQKGYELLDLLRQEKLITW